jgi:hypothetical protein
MGYSLDVLSAPQATELIRRLEEASLGKSIVTRPQQPAVEDFARPQPAVEDTLSSKELAELFFPLDHSWIGIGIGGDNGDGMVLDVAQGTGFRFNEFVGQ